ncbi:ATP-binding cassette domain-containing protein [Candidatus Halocynthiibacter alkanivorans]|uniref:ATP-binding cassette domain-containing protein n=1 Tax=Candidatus Halocynthiibacter alkanivorans TaxID=2267619 RepID=UPI000DF2462F|nr:ATP-binding cassette domain-containing protein [Candidatus Halocynthiibacter alkanivorans]
MSNTPVAFSVTASRKKTTLSPGPGPAARAADPSQTQAPGRSQFENRLHARAGIAAVLASRIGADVATSDLVDHIAAQGEDDVAPDALAAALRAQKIDARVQKVAQLSPDHWPAIASMSGGRLVLVLSQQAGVLTIYDDSCAGNRTEVPLAEFAPYYTGTLLQARLATAQLARTHVPDSTEAHWFWSQFPKFRRQIGEIALGSFVANLLAVAVALFSLQVYDRVIPNQSIPTLWVLAIGAFTAIVMEVVLKLARARLMDSAGRIIELNVQSVLMDRILGMRSDRRANTPSGLFSAMREFGSVREFFTSSTIGTIADVPFIFVFLLLVASIAGNLVWVLMLGGVLMLLPGYFMQRRMVALTLKAQGASAKASRLLHETIFELDTLKTLRGEDRVRRLWHELNLLGAQTSGEQRKLASALSFWSQGVQQATYISAVVYGTYQVFAGNFTVGTIIAVGLLTSRTLAPLTQLSGTMARWSNVKAALAGLDAIALAEQDQSEGRRYLRREQLQGRFELRELSYRYEDDAAPVLEVPGIDIQAGQSLAILGSNGSGKSTLLKILSGLHAPTSGRVMLDGVDMAMIDPRDIRRNIGYLSQDVRLFAGTLRDNLNLNMLERNDDRLLQALDFAGLGPFLRAHHRGLDLEISDSGAGLSVGQRQSIGWARLWLQDPRIVLLDEPTAALDQTLEATLVSRLESWLKGRTAIIATHRLPILSLTERTLILQNGRLAVDGPRDAVLAHLQKGRGESAG